MRVLALVSTYNFSYYFYSLVSPCAVAPCMNGGICENVGKGYKCTCAPGYHGDRCQNEGETLFDTTEIISSSYNTSDGLYG